MRLYENSSPTRRSIFVHALQPVDVPRQNRPGYGDGASGPIIYAYVGGNPISNSDPLGLICRSGNGSTTCVTPDGSIFRVPTPSGFPSYIGPDGNNDWYHQYDITRDLDGADPVCVFNEIAKNPTPGVSKPATPNGTGNNAEVLPGWNNYVTSYLTKDLATGMAIEINIAGTNDGSAFGPGYVARYVRDGVAHTAGEGQNWKQAPALTGEALQNIGNQAVWGSQLNEFIKKCKCK